MPESNEDTNAPGDKLPPRRRRRAASRPAGPPVTGATAETPAADAPEAVEVTRSAPEPAAPAEAEAAPAPR
ncbi:hypothetical protein GTY86_35285, partial [Streptomyces sp. SID5770]